MGRASERGPKAGVEAKVADFERYRSFAGEHAMFDVVDGHHFGISTYLYFLFYHFVKGRYRSIADPACGKENYCLRDLVDVFKYWGIEYLPCDKDPDNWAARNGYRNAVCDVLSGEGLPDAEVWFYDPPYLPTKSRIPRKAAYAMDGYSLQEIRRFYSEQVFQNFIAHKAKMIIVKGADFYYPPGSNDLYLFESIVSPAKNMRLVASLRYRYYDTSGPYINRAVGKVAQTRPRAHIISTRFLIFLVG